jgi:hypothetical protein
VNKNARISCKFRRLNKVNQLGKAATACKETVAPHKETVTAYKENVTAHKKTVTTDKETVTAYKERNM